MTKFQITYKASPRDQLSNVAPTAPETITATTSQIEGEFTRFYDEDGLVLSVDNERILEVRRVES